MRAGGDQVERRLELLAELTPAIWMHLGAAVFAAALGGLILWRRKGDRLHRWTGRLWVALIAAASISSFWITEIIPGWFSPIHLLSIYTLVNLVISIVAIRNRHRWRRGLAIHRTTMVQIYAAGILIAGGFTFLPVRLLGRLTFGEWMPALNLALVALFVGGGVVLLWRTRHYGRG